jgi:hypothetical protein
LYSVVLMALTVLAMNSVSPVGRGARPQTPVPMLLLPAGAVLDL